tara:strand:+ start:1729 stop:1848 length:120 start_codon:yes stop_codon:yes gene_type:complete
MGNIRCGSMKGDMRPNRSKEVEDEVDLVSPEPDMILLLV